MAALKVLIADDDADIRLIIKKVIDKVEGFELAGEAADGETTIHLAETLRPHVIFMDIEMPGIDGVECAKRITETNPKTFFIFATAHEEYMSDAFQLYAADYLVKPFKLERIIQTLERLKEQLKQLDFQIFEKRIQREKGLEKIMIRNKESLSLIDTRDIILIQREERNTVIYTTDSRYPTSDTLNELEEKLDNKIFFRSHKSYIINLAMVQKIYPYGRWTYLVKFKNLEQDALITYERYKELEQMFNA